MNNIEGKVGSRSVDGQDGHPGGLAAQLPHLFVAPDRTDSRGPHRHEADKQLSSFVCFSTQKNYMNPEESMRNWPGRIQAELPSKDCRSAAAYELDMDK